MIIWSGRGFFVILVLVLLIVGSGYVLPIAYNDYTFIIAFFGTAIFSWYFGVKWNKKKARAVIDKETGEEFVIKPNHSLFWIKVQYRAIIFALLGFLVVGQLISEAS